MTLGPQIKVPVLAGHPQHAPVFFKKRKKKKGRKEKRSWGRERVKERKKRKGGREANICLR